MISAEVYYRPGGLRPLLRLKVDGEVVAQRELPHDPQPATIFSVEDE